jgi:2-isopropylmalate synthase/UPF0716 protein FxsA
VIVYILLYFFFEVVITIEVGSYLGGLGTFFEIILSFIVGLFIIKNFKYSVAESLASLQKGEMSEQDVVSSHIFSLLGALCLMLPGIVSDVLGLLMQIEAVAIFTASKVKFKQKEPMNSSSHFSTNDQNYYYHQTTYNSNQSTTKSSENDDIIDVEIIDTPTPIDSKEKK